LKIYDLKKIFKRIRSFGTFYIAEQTSQFLQAIRLHELNVIINMLPSKGRLLEIGAGTGWQSQAFEKLGYNVSAIDLQSSNYFETRIWPVTDYDGRKIPFDDNTFSIVFSSNALEHIPHIYEFQDEIHRVLKPDGCVIHILPSSSWRLWSIITHLFKFWTFPNVHGEHATNAFSEIYYFSRIWWTKLFRSTGWVIVAQSSNKLFYTGSSIVDSNLSIRMRSKLSRVLGGSCNIFFLKNKLT
jgi:2-polyprenyl-3-methyl-5-hydroxy-6-metoxy-1,4-benzoquinol methylase